MPKFVFKLEPVLKQRKHEEQQRQRELALKHAAFVELQNVLKQLNDRVNASNEDVRRNRLLGPVDMNFLAAHRRFLVGMQRRAVETIQRMALAQKQVDEAQALLAEASRRRKTMEKLREMQYARWRAEIQRKELIELDEIGTQLAYRNLVEEQAESAR